MHPAFGLDISDAWIRLALLTRRGRSMYLPIRGEIPVPSGLIEDGDIHDPKGVSRLLQQLLKAAGIKNHEAYVSLPERHTFLKLIEIPNNRADGLSQAVKDEAMHHLPYAWDEVYFDWQSVHTGQADEHTSVLIGAAPKTFVEGYLSVLEESNIEPLGIEIESVAIARGTLRKPIHDHATIILDLGRTRSTLILVQHGFVLFSATVRYAGTELNKFIAEQLHITEEQAERAKQIFGLDPNRGKGMLRTVLAPFLDNLVEKIAEVETFYHEHVTSHQPIEQIFLTGSGAQMRMIDQELQARLKRPVTIQPSWITEELRQHDHDLDPSIGFTYATAFGLALSNFEGTL